MPLKELVFVFPFNNSRNLPTAMKYRKPVLSSLLTSFLVCGIGLAGCMTNESKPSEPAQQAQPASKKAEAPAPVAAAPMANGQYDLSRNKPVTDSSTVEAGKGTLVKGINDWEGEISGIPARGSKFTKLKIGMSTDEVFRLIGQPSGMSSYPTGKAHIPFYHGADRWRQEAIYKGQGRLIFSQQGGWGASEFNLIWIIHSANEK